MSHWGNRLIGNRKWSGPVRVPLSLDRAVACRRSLSAPSSLPGPAPTVAAPILGLVGVHATVDVVTRGPLAPATLSGDAQALTGHASTLAAKRANAAIGRRRLLVQGRSAVATSPVALISVQHFDHCPWPLCQVERKNATQRVGLAYFSAALLEDTEDTVTMLFFGGVAWAFSAPVRMPLAGPRVISVVGPS